MSKEAKIIIQVSDNEFPEYPPFPEHLVRMWTGIQEEMQCRLQWAMLLAMLPIPLMPLSLIVNGSIVKKNMKTRIFNKESSKP